MKKEIDNTIKVLEKGGVILYPTDTIWGIGCDATNCEAISKIFKIKKRNNSKALISLVSDSKHLKEITGFIPKIDITSKPTTIVYNSASKISTKLLSKNGSAAIRIVQDSFCKKLIKKFGKPIVSTSANVSGLTNPTSFSEISQEIKKNVDYIVNLRHNELMINPSTILILNKDGSITKIR